MTEPRRTKTSRLAEELRAYVLQREPLIENADGMVEIRARPKANGTYEIEMKVSAH